MQFTAESQRIELMKRQSTIVIPLLACAAILRPSGDAKAQYYSFAISVGGGTTAAAHFGMHLGNADRRRWNLDQGSTEIEVVVGLPMHDRLDGRVKPGVSFGLNLRKTDPDTRFSVGAGFRVSPLAIRGTTDWQTVFHIPVGWDPYPLPIRPTVYFGYGRRMVPTDEAGSAHEWRFLVPWPQLQVYLKHTGGFNWT